VQSLTDSIENERKLRLSAEQHVQEVSLRMEVLSSYFNEKEKEFDRYLTSINYHLFSIICVMHRDILSSAL